MYQNTVSAGAQSVRATSKFGKLVRFVAGAMGFGAMVFGSLPEANAQTYSLATLSTVTSNPGSFITVSIAGTTRPIVGVPNSGTHSAVNVTNAWHLNGQSNAPVTFNVNLTSGSYTPAPGDAFHIYNYGSIDSTIPNSSIAPGFTPPTNAPRYVNYNYPPLSQSYYVWRADWSIPNQFWFRVEALENQIGLNIAPGHGTNYGNATVTGSNGNYLPGIVDVLPDVNDGHISIDGPFPEMGPPGELWVLADLEGYTSVADFMTSMVLFDDSPTFTYELAGETNFEAMRAKFGSDWEVLLKFQGLPAGASNTNMRLNWSFQRDTGTTVDRLLVIPEPATMFVCVAGILGLVTYRPHRSRRAA